MFPFAIGKEEIGLLDTIVKGGGPLILAVFCALEGFTIWMLYKSKSALETEYRHTLEAQISAAVEGQKPLTEALTKTNEVISRVEVALRDNSDTLTRGQAFLDQAARDRG